MSNTQSLLLAIRALDAGRYCKEDFTDAANGFAERGAACLYQVLRVLHFEALCSQGLSHR